MTTAPGTTTVPETTVPETTVPETTVPPMAHPRLVVAINPPSQETNLTWEGLSQATNLQLRHCLDALIAIDPETGAYVPGLAESWEMTTPDAMTWTVHLRQGVQFHRGYGEFTARDVVENFVLTTSEDAKSSDAGRVRSILGETADEIRANIETPDPYTVVFHLIKPRVDFDFLISAKVGTLFMHSAAQIEQDGLDAIRDPAIGPVGTGPWEYVERVAGQYILFKRVEDHWRKTPEFEELELRLVPEAATRMAMLLTGEVDMAVIDRALLNAAVVGGAEIINSPNPASGLMFSFGGNYYPGFDAYDPAEPMTNVLVREAINKAIDRQGILDAFFPGSGQMMYLMSYHPSSEYWDPAWEAGFEEAYGYNPEEAIALLREAGYEDGFDLKVAAGQFPAVPETATIAEAVAGMLDAIGIRTTIVAMDQDEINALADSRETQGYFWPVASSFRPVQALLQGYTQTGSDGTQAQCPSAEIDELYLQLTEETDPATRQGLLAQIGNLKYSLYAEAPIVWLPAQIAVNPAVVGSYTYPGDIAGGYSHFEYATPAE